SRCRHTRAKRDWSSDVCSSDLAIYLAESRRAAQAAFRVFRSHWQEAYPGMVKRLEKDLPELLTFFDFPRHLWRKLRTTNVIERRSEERRVGQRRRSRKSG